MRSYIVKSLTYRYYWTTIKFSPKSPKNIVFGRESSCFDFSKKIYTKPTSNFFDEKSKTGLGFESGQPPPKCQRRPTLQSMANPAVRQIQDHRWEVLGEENPNLLCVRTKMNKAESDLPRQILVCRGLKPF